MDGMGSGGRWEGVEPSPAGAGGGDDEEAPWGDEDGAIRRALGVEDVYGYHVEDGAPRIDHARVHVHVDDAGAFASSPSFPCLDGCTYTGCIGAACPLETCWTGMPTVGFARKVQAQTRVSAGLYLPGAPCHGCASLEEDTVPVPAPRSIAQLAGGGGEERGCKDEVAVLKRVNCAQGLWAHPVSLSSFVARRIPMLDQDDPERCPGFIPRSHPHPAVAEHLHRRRERARRQRDELRALEQERQRVLPARNAERPH